MRSRNILHSAFILGSATRRAGAHAGTLAGARHWSGCSNCWAVTTTPQIWEAGRPRPQDKGVTGTFTGTNAGTFTGTNTGTEAGNFDSNTLP